MPLIGSRSVGNSADIVSLAETIRSRIYIPVAKFEITAWRTREPVSFAEKMSGSELSLNVGDTWGEQLFDCAWFRFVATIPENGPRSLVARIDVNGELALVDAAGVPVRGLTCAKSTFDPTLGAPTKMIYQIPEHRVQNGHLELWADAGFNDLFGMVIGEGRIECAEVCVCRQDLRALYYDLQVLGDFLAGLPAESSSGAPLLAAVNNAAASLGNFESASVEEAREVLVPLFAETAPRPNLQISALGHAHMDLAWLWPIRETLRKGARTFATALYNIARYPDYLYGCSQPQLFAWMKEHYPALYADVKSAVKAGRIEPLGRFWVEPDCNIPSGESYVRQVLYGARFFKDEFGIVPRFCWLPDVFGYHAQLPQILTKSGHDYFVTQKLSWNIVNRFPFHSFHWEGIDGSRILAHMLPEETYNSPAAPQSLRKIGHEYAQKDVSSHALLSFGIGDGGGGPDAEHLERLFREKHLGDLPTVVQRTAADFLELWAQEADQFPTWSGELYLERHQGTFTTQALSKRNNRLCEISLREVEWSAMLAEVYANIPYPFDDLDTLWQEVLLYQFHDILPGSSIKRVYSESNARYQIILQQLEELIASNYRLVASKISGDSTCLILNSLPWARSEWRKVHDQWLLLEVPAMGYTLLPLPVERPAVSAQDRRLENDQLRVEFASDGTICSLYDKPNKRKVLAKGEAGNQFVVFSDDGDAWDFPTDHKNKDVWVYLRQKLQVLKLETAHGYIDGPQAIIEQVYTFGTSRLTQRIVLTANSFQLEFDTVVDWREPATMLRVRFPIAVESPEARFEIPFGSLRRSTSEFDLIQKAQFEVPAQQWVDLSQEDYGVALLNDCKYGFRVKGHTLDMNLLRSVPHPGKALIDKEDTSGTGGVYTDLGCHEFRYAILPHANRMEETEITRAARSFNIPLRVVAREMDGSFQLPPQASFITMDNPAIDIAAIKRAENGKGWIVRLVNVSPALQHVRLHAIFDIITANETDLMEEDSIVTLLVETDGSISLKLTGFEIKTVRLRISQACQE